MEMAYGQEDARASCDYTSRFETRMEARRCRTTAILFVMVFVYAGRLAAVPGEYYFDKYRLRCGLRQ